MHKSGLNNQVEEATYFRISKYFERIQGALISHQYGFQKGKSFIAVVIQFIVSDHNTLNENKYLIAIFLDFSKAFDTVRQSCNFGKKMECVFIRGLVWFLSQ